MNLLIKLWSFVLLNCIIINQVLTQDNAGTSIAPALIECYNNSLILTRDLRLPATINTLIDLIRKAEDGNPAVNARELAIQLLHRFRQDGMFRNQRFNDTSYALPYSPRRFESYKNRVQLKKLTPGSALTFNNDSLNHLQRCSLHSMISSTIELQERGDESTVCTGLSRYTSRLHKRDIDAAAAIEPFAEKVTNQGSNCPIESGVIYTRWGAVKAGLLISGIASGFQPLSIPTISGYNSDNRYASTLSGELSEAALYQATGSIKIGTNGGGWNSTIIPKYYFIQSQDNLQVTDAEIRGGLDGLYMALNIDIWKTKFSNIKISQILDMYYSARGVFNNTIRACNRKLLETELISTINVQNETTKFNYLLDAEAVYATVSEDSFPLLAQNSMNSFNSYITSLNDLDCSAEETTIERAKTDLIIFLDTNWNYKTIQPIISYILDNIDINKYDSRYTLYAGGNVNEIINITNSILNFHENYTLVEHQKYATGFDYNRIYELTESLVKNKLDNSTDINGQSLILLLIPYKTPTDSEKEYAKLKKENFKSYLPDIRTIVLGTGSSQDSYSDLVSSSTNDVFITTDTTDQTTQKSIAKSVADRIKRIHRSVVNPNCGSSFQSSTTSSFDLVQYVEPQGVNYHRISANYFFKGNSDETNRNLKIRGANYGTLIVCMSRSESYPRNNSTGNNCTTINTNEISFDITNYCTDDVISDCQPIYLSVEGVLSNIRCSDTLCRFPDSIKYTISLENVGCASGSERVLSLFSFIALLPVLLRFIF